MLLNLIIYFIILYILNNLFILFILCYIILYYIIYYIIYYICITDLQNISQGLYLQALCEGMDQALEPFRKEIVNLEDIVLRDSYTPLSLILCRIQKYICLFSVLNSIIREVN